MRNQYSLEDCVSLDDMKPAKYYSSILLRFRSQDRFLYRFSDRNELNNFVTEITNRVRNCMIYLICSRPIISILPETFKKDGDQFEFDITFRTEGKETVCSVKTPKGLIQDLGGKVSISDYPYNRILNYDQDGNPVTETLISNFVHLLHGVPPVLSEHEVLYIGKGTADCAVDRLDGHSTLERVLTDVLQKDPSKEVAILIYNFGMQKDAIVNPGIGSHAEVRGGQAKAHFKAILDFRPGINEQTEIAEALLIDYFKTNVYNRHFTNGYHPN